ncbi:hypothetical protein [Streptomyces candidus]|uniref:Uncharacterized protein n=1 Tax=Streptomyces candidus TaxID=67283 RepID=A0A7X0HL58_9ACTN|nr:hypothetical protein [Streptomyces candidus]MBB6438173.1 hypothetical protein [Streptomyces candidus]
MTSSRDLVVVAPNSTVNTGTVMGGQRHTVSHLTGGATSAVPLLQGPVRAKYLETARRRFVPPPSFEEALAAVDSGITVLLGDRGTGRETHALNLLAHGGEDPVLVQVDGAVNLSRWRPRPQGVHGYLVMEPPDPFTLRAWELSRLETPLAEANARLIIVLTDAPGLADALADHLGVPVVRHHPPDARKVFSAHFTDGSSDGEACAAWLRALPPGQLEELLPEGLPPRHAARTAHAAFNLGVVGGASGAEVLRHVALIEGTEAVARTQTDPVLRADLLAVTVYGGLQRGVVAERSEDLLRLVEPGETQTACAWSSYDPSAADTRRRLGPEALRLLGAQRVRRAGDGVTDCVSFFRPAMREAVWEVLCRDHTDLIPLLHSWLADPGPEAEQVEKAGRAVAAMAVTTGGRSLAHLQELALAPSCWAPQVAGWCLATAVQDPAAGRTAADLLEQWSVATEASLRETVLHACCPDRGEVAEERALGLLQQLLTTLDHDTNAVAVATAVAETLKRRFEAGDSRARRTVLRCMHDWSRGEDIPSLLAALCFPAMVHTDLTWWSDQMRADAQLVSGAVRLAAHALNESSSFGSMHDALVDWCAEAVRAGYRARALSELLDGLVDDRQPGFLRWLLAVERCSESMPGKKLATQALTAWRAKSPVSNSD